VTEPLVIFIPGWPVPGGSKRAFALRRKDGSLVTRPDGAPVINVTDDAGERNRQWKQTVAFFAKKAYPWSPLTEPLRVCFRFVMPRLKGHFGSGRNAGVLKPGAPRCPTVKPDVSKLVRAAEDACTGILWADDALIVEQYASKVYGEKPGLELRVEVLSNAAVKSDGFVKGEAPELALF
jgi:Holliday junction resolvase RusA-like endonuclease